MTASRTTCALAGLLLFGLCLPAFTYGYKLSSSTLENAEQQQQAILAKNQTIVVALCGSSSESPSNTVEIYSLSSNSRVKRGAAAPERRYFLATAIFNNTIYVVGGYDGDNYQSTLWCYDIAKDQWNDNLPDAPSVVVGSAGVEVGGRMYILGGRKNHTAESTQVYAYETRLRKWYTLDTAIPQTSRFPCAVAQEKLLYYMPEGSLYHSDDGAKTWERLRSPSVNRSEAACVAVGKDAILLAGGVNEDNTVLNSVEIYNITTDQWKTVAPMTTARHGGSGELLLPSRDNVLVCGGFTDSGDTDGLETCEAYDWSKNKWSKASYEMDQPRAYFGLFVTQANV